MPEVSIETIFRTRIPSSSYLPKQQLPTAKEKDIHDDADVLALEVTFVAEVWYTYRNVERDEVDVHYLIYHVIGLFYSQLAPVYSWHVQLHLS
jgi:hypothetical protein